MHTTVPELNNDIPVGYAVRPAIDPQKIEGVFYDTDSYVEVPGITIERLTEDVTTFMAEILMKSTKRYAYYNPDDNEWYHPDGLAYSEFFDHAIAKFSDSPLLFARFQAEKQGYERAKAYLVSNVPAEFSFFIESQPGDVYRNGKIKPKSVHFEATHVVDRFMSLGDGPEKLYREFSLYAIPTEEMTMREHWALVRELSDVGSSLSTLGLLSTQLDENSPDELVSLPFLLSHTLDTYAQKLGYAAFDQIEQEATHYLELENDVMAKERRLDMIAYFVENMHPIITNTEMTPRQKKLRLKAYASTMHNYFASEAGAEYLGLSFADIRAKIEGHARVEIRDLGAPLTADEWLMTDWIYAELAREEYFLRLRNNPEAQRRRESIACVRIAVGPDGFDTNRFDPGGFSNTLFFDYNSNTTNTYSYFTNQTENKSEKLHEGEATCYPCPLCQKEGAHSDVHLRGGYLVCDNKPQEHRLKYGSSD